MKRRLATENDDLRKPAELPRLGSTFWEYRERSPVLLGRPNHRQDAGADGFGQLGPGFNHGRQIGVKWGRFWLDGAAFGALAVRRTAFSRRFRRVCVSPWGYFPII